MECVVGNPKDSIREFNKRFQLNEVENKAVNWGFEYESGYRMFHVVNAYTNGAQYNDLNVESSHKLQKVGGSILALVN